jgi:hypothetical protein
MVKYMVRLHTEAREPVLAFVHTGRAAPAKRLQARMLLKANVGASARHWTDAAMAAAVGTSAATVHRVRQTWVEQGLAVAGPASARPAGRIAHSTGPRRPS